MTTVAATITTRITTATTTGVMGEFYAAPGRPPTKKPPP